MSFPPKSVMWQRRKSGPLRILPRRHIISQPSSIPSQVGVDILNKRFPQQYQATWQRWRLFTKKSHCQTKGQKPPTGRLQADLVVPCLAVSLQRSAQSEAGLHDVVHHVVPLGSMTHCVPCHALRQKMLCAGTQDIGQVASCCRDSGRHGSCCGPALRMCKAD